MEIEQYKYEILKFLQSNQGKTDVETLITEFTKGLENDELLEARNNTALTIMKMYDHIPKYINANFSPHSGLFKFLDEQAWRQERQEEFGMHDADKKITITEDGMINLKSLKELYDPSPPIIPQQNTYITTHGHNSPAAGHDVTLRDIKSNEESEHSKELAKEQLTDIKPNRWYRHWGFIVAVILLLMGLVTLLLMLRS